MRHSSRGSVFCIAGLIALALSTSADASQCLYPGDTAVGPTRPTIQAARNAAMASWERVVAKKRGRRFAVWTYAGDGVVDCVWNRRGNIIRCRATAVACYG